MDTQQQAVDSRNPLKCTRCEHVWPRRDLDKLPLRCPECNSPYWDKPRKKEFIYLAVNEAKTEMKIGVTNNLSQRQCHYNGEGTGFKITLNVEGNRQLEKDLCARFAHLLIRGNEWFTYSEDIANYLVSIGAKPRVFTSGAGLARLRWAKATPEDRKRNCDHMARVAKEREQFADIAPDILRLQAQGMTLANIAKQIGCRTGTVCRKLKQYHAAQSSH